MTELRDQPTPTTEQLKYIVDRIDRYAEAFDSIKMQQVAGDLEDLLAEVRHLEQHARDAMERDREYMTYSLGQGRLDEVMAIAALVAMEPPKENTDG